MAKTTVVVTPTIDTSIYAAGDCVGGLLTFSNVLRVSGAGKLSFLRLIDRVNQQAVLDLYLFSAKPAGTYTDQAAMVATADGAILIDVVPIAAADYRLVTGTIYIARPAIATPIDLQSLAPTLDGGTLWGALKLVSGTPTFSSATALTLRMGIEHQ